MTSNLTSAGTLAQYKPACACLLCFKLSNLILSHYSFIHLDYVYIIEHFRLIFVIVLMSTFNIQIMKQVSKFFVVHVCFEIRNEWSSRYL